MKNFLRILSSSVISIICSLVIAILIPIKLGVTEFGYWQIFFLYSGFLGLFTFGFLDGIHLKYSGLNKNNTNKKLFRTYFRFLNILLFSICFMFITIIYFLPINPQKETILYYLSINLILFNLNGFFIHYYQVTSEFKMYSVSLTLDKIFFVFLIMPILFIQDFNNYKIVIFANVASRLILLIIQLNYSKEILFGERYRIFRIKKLILRNIKRGSLLTVSLLISILLFSYPRIIVERTFPIELFSIFSLSMSILSMVVQILSSSSAYVYSYLKKIDKSQINFVLKNISNILSLLTPLILFSYYIIYILISEFMPRYNGIFEYMFMVFPVIIFQLRNNILIINSYKIISLEKNLFYNNIFTFITIVFIFLFTNLYFSLDIKMIVSIFLVMNIFYSILMTYRINKVRILDLSYPINEMILSLIFILVNYLFNALLAISIMSFIFLIYYLIERKKMVCVKNTLKRI